MSIYRINKQSKFTQIDNRMIEDDQISAKAKGILVYLLSKPDGWQVYETDIIKSMKDGRDGIRSGLRELVDSGYINRKQKQGEDGKFNGYDYEVYEYKLENPNYNRDGITVNGKTVDGKTDNGKPATSNTNLSNTNLSNIKTIVEPKASTPVINKNDEIIKKVIQHLNDKTGKRFRASTNAHYKSINARLNDGYTLDDILYVIDNKCLQWLNTRFEDYLTPTTLFRPSNFVNYLNESPYKPKGNHIQDAAVLMQMANEAEKEELANGTKRRIESNGDDTHLLPF